MERQLPREPSTSEGRCRFHSWHTKSRHWGSLGISGHSSNWERCTCHCIIMESMWQISFIMILRISSTLFFSTSSLPLSLKCSSMSLTEECSIWFGSFSLCWRLWTSSLILSWKELKNVLHFGLFHIITKSGSRGDFCKSARFCA